MVDSCWGGGGGWTTIIRIEGVKEVIVRDIIVRETVILVRRVITTIVINQTIIAIIAITIIALTLLDLTTRAIAFTSSIVIAPALYYSIQLIANRR